MPATRFVSAVRPARPSPQLLSERSATMQRLRTQVADTARRLAWPRIQVPAHQVYFRFVDHTASYLKTYSDLFRLPPDNDGVGGKSRSNRFTGLLPDGSVGLSGSYWGTSNGVAAEDHYYQCWKGYDGSGPPRLMAAYGHVLVQRILGKLKYGMDGDVPQQLLFSGNSATNLLVARTIRPIESLNLNLGSDEVQDFLAKVEVHFKPMLDALQFPTLQAAIEDPDFRDFARSVAFGGATGSRSEGIWVRSVREEAKGLRGFDPDDANNLVLVGQGRDTLTDRLVGCGVIEIRSDSNGLQVSAAPLIGPDARYADPSPMSLMVIPTPEPGPPPRKD